MRNRTYYSIVRSIRHQQHGGLVLTRTSSSVSSTCQETEAVDDHNFDHNLDRTTSKIKIPFGFVTPKPKPLRVADGNYKGAFKAVLAAGLRLGSGIFTVGWRPIASTVGPWPGTLGFLRDGTSVIGECARPVRPLILWDNEADPRCRIVREACSMLDLETEMRPQVGINAGPALQDGTIRLENTREIVDHLFKNYGPGKSRVPWLLRENALTHWSMSLVSTVREHAGLQLLADALPEPERATLSPLLLWGFEGSPFVRPVRETLSSLGLRHQLVNCARGSLNRDRLFQRTGRFQVPYLEDPNTGVRMFESGEIVKYLLAAYTTSTCSSISASATPTSTTISSSCGSTHGGVAGAL